MRHDARVRITHVLSVVTVVVATVLLAGCGTTQGTPVTSRTSATSVTPEPNRPTDGEVVVLDPGHDGGNASHPDAIHRKVPAGRGRTKQCNTVGTGTDDGYPEHAFTWDVALRARTLLEADGFTVILTRHSDTGVGPCVNERAAIGNRAEAAAVVSIHADGNTTPGARGFHVAYSSPPVNAAQGEPSLRLAKALRSAMREAGFPVSNYIGEHGLDGRDDLGGLNLSTQPVALLECGNMRNQADAEVLTSPRGRQRYARAIAAAIGTYLS